MPNRIKTWINRQYNKMYFSVYRTKSSKEVFEDIYKNKKWDGNSYSGPGSDIDQTRLMCHSLGKILDDFDIKSMLDVPCGDWFWMRHMDLSAVTYTGGDIVAKIVHENQQYAKANVSFEFLDLLQSQIPTNDLIFCRDCLVHFSYKDIRKALTNLINSNCKYLLTTTFPGRRNRDIVTGSWRPIDLQADPFVLPKPIMIVNEGCTEGDGAYSDKSLGLWDLSVLNNEVSFIENHLKKI